MTIIFDGNYLFHKSFSVFCTYYKPEELPTVLAQPEKQQVLIRKCITDMCATINKFDNLDTEVVDKVVFVIDSRSWRNGFYDDYKHALTKVKPDYYMYFLDILDQLEALCRDRGLIVSRVEGAEGDDLLYWWSLVLGQIEQETCIIISGDGDIRQLISHKISVYNNNSKVDKFYCHFQIEKYWEFKLGDNWNIETINPIDVVLQKAILGDSGDNIPTVKKGFGVKSLEKIIDEKTYDRFYRGRENFNSICYFISKLFSEHTGMSFKEVYKKVEFNLHMAWLDMETYSHLGLNKLVEDILDDIKENKDSYKYNKAFTLESFYGMLIK